MRDRKELVAEWDLSPFQSSPQIVRADSYDLRISPSHTGMATPAPPSPVAHSPTPAAYEWDADPFGRTHGSRGVHSNGHDSPQHEMTTPRGYARSISGSLAVIPARS